MAAALLVWSLNGVADVLPSSLSLPPISDLPPPALVRSALEKHPDVQAAAAGLVAGESRRDRLVAGPHEFELVLGKSRRRETTSGQTLGEGEVALQRSLRLPGKGALDARLGEELVEHARYTHGDALHETGRLLLSSWFAVKRETLALGEAQAQMATWAEQVRVTRRRVDLGDAAALELALTEAQLAQAEALGSQMATRLRDARESFVRHFPGLPLPGNGALPEPDSQPISEAWVDHLIAHDHELLTIRSEARQSRLMAQRAEQEQYLPDPRLALRWGSERDGQEKIVGLQLTIPLPGSGRAADSRAANANADGASAREAAQLARATSEARRTVKQVEANQRQWRSLEEAARRMSRNAELLDKAWRLGEGSINELINARRLAGEARLAAAQARADAHESLYRFALDAHVFWSFDTDEDEHHHEFSSR